jgi:NDP-sugar pyrophosphorylase family protein
MAKYFIEYFNCYNYIKNCKYNNKLKAINEPKPMGTGGAINYVIKNSSISSPFFVINGDSLSDIDLNLMVKEFSKNRYKAMIGIS